VRFLSRHRRVVIYDEYYSSYVSDSGVAVAVVTVPVTVMVYGDACTRVLVLLAAVLVFRLLLVGATR
jgi:hypothetical protein